MTEFDIRRRALFVERSLLGSAAAFPAAVSLLEYAALCVPVSHGARTVSSWSDALEAALREHDHILIPASA